MASRTLNLTECVLPPVPLRQWVLTFPFAWRSRLGFDAALFSALTRVFVHTVLAFYAERMKKAGVSGGHSGAVVALQRTSFGLRLNPHLQLGSSVSALALGGLGPREVDAHGALRRSSRQRQQAALARGAFARGGDAYARR